jgi:hypothetical protein
MLQRFICYRNQTERYIWNSPCWCFTLYMQLTIIICVIACYDHKLVYWQCNLHHKISYDSNGSIINSTSRVRCIWERGLVTKEREWGKMSGAIVIRREVVRICTIILWFLLIILKAVYHKIRGYWLQSFTQMNSHKYINKLILGNKGHVIKKWRVYIKFHHIRQLVSIIRGADTLVWWYHKPLFHCNGGK